MPGSCTHCGRISCSTSSSISASAQQFGPAHTCFLQPVVILLALDWNTNLSLFPACLQNKILFYAVDDISFCNPPSTPAPARHTSTPPSPATAKTSPAQLSANTFCPSHTRALATSRDALRTSQILTAPSYDPLANCVPELCAKTRVAGVAG
jgi:hypothetical protein